MVFSSFFNASPQHWPMNEAHPLLASLWEFLKAMKESSRGRLPALFKERTLREPPADSTGSPAAANPFVVEDSEAASARPPALPQPLQPRPFLQHVLNKVVDRRTDRRRGHRHAALPDLSSDSKCYNTVDNRRAAEFLAYENPEWITSVKARRPELPSIVAERQRREAKIKQAEEAAIPVQLNPLEAMVDRLERAETEYVAECLPQPPPPPARRGSFRRLNDFGNA